MDELVQARIVLAESAGIEADALKDDVELQLLGIDSVMLINALVRLEGHYGIELSGAQLDVNAGSTLREIAEIVAAARVQVA